MFLDKVDYFFTIPKSFSWLFIGGFKSFYQSNVVPPFFSISFK